MSPLRPHHRKLLGAGALLFLALAAAWLRAGTSTEVLGIRVGLPWVMGDFKSVVHCPLLTFLHGGNPYEARELAEVCPGLPAFPLFAPATLVIHAPFGMLPFAAAARAFAGWSLALTVLTVYMAFRVNGVRPTTAGVTLVLGLLLLSRPGQWNLLLGNLAVEFTLASYIALHYAHRSPVRSGIGLALAAIKPTFGVPLAILMLARRDYRAVALGVAFALLGNLPPLLVLAKRTGGLDRLAQGLIETQREWGAIVSEYSVYTTYRVDLSGFLIRLLGHPLGNQTEALAALGVLLTAALAIRSLGRQPDAARRRLSSDIACVAVVLCVYHLGYDLVLLMAPAIALTLRTLPEGFATPRFRSVMLLLIAGLAANYLTSEAVLARLREYSLAWALLASINCVLLLALFLGYVSRTLRYRGLRGEVSSTMRLTPSAPP